MSQARAEETRKKLIDAATDLVRRQGYNATSVDDICRQAGITKGAFFHHYASKEALVEAALDAWRDMFSEVLKGGDFHALRDPRKRVLGFMDFMTGLFADPQMLKSCLAGTTAQEAAMTHPNLRVAANTCFVKLEEYFQTLLDGAMKGSRRKVDTASLAALWVATMQGSLILFKASQDASLIAKNMTHVRAYIAAQLPEPRRTP